MMLRPRKSVSPRCHERGYILITLILFVALLAIAATIMAPVVAFQVKRDREEELIHRGVQYSRAMKHFVKKFGRYPTRIEDLENTNQVRFLRKRYKDPITGKDFKLLHMGEVQMAFGAGVPGAGLGGVAGGPGGPAGMQNAAGAINTMAMAGGLAAAAMNGGNPGQTQPSGITTLNSGGAQNSDQEAGDATPGGPNTGANQPPGTPGTPGAPGAATPGSAAPGAQVFGGGPIVGVASTSKAKSIRVFNKKDHYYQWQFIYDPSTDRGGLLTTPNQPGLQGAATALQGTPGAPGAPGGSLGQPGTGMQPGQPTQSSQPTQPGITPQMPPDQERP